MLLIKYWTLPIKSQVLVSIVFKAMVANALTEIFIKGLLLELLVKATGHCCESSLIRQGNIAVNKGKGLNLSC